jgi:hypothetical protein
LPPQVDIYWESGFAPDWTIKVPNIRELGPLLMQDLGDPAEPFRRPTHNGRAMGVQIDADTVLVDPVRSFSVFERILDGSEWTCSQSDNGRFASRLMELLGGIDSQAGNQPAVREVLKKAARTPHGAPFDSLIKIAEQYQGAWPGPFSSPAAQVSYPKSVVLRLLAQKLLRPVLPVRCPHCATQSTVRPDDLADEIRCEMCSSTFALGLALGVAGPKANWKYRLQSFVVVGDS